MALEAKAIDMKKLLFYALIVILAQGCTTIGGNKAIMDVGFLEKVKIGITKDEVRVILGEPQHMGTINTKDVWRYQALEKHTNAACFIPIVDTAGRQTLRARIVDIYFEQDKVADIQVDQSMKERMLPIGTAMLGISAIGVAGIAASPSYGPYGGYRGDYSKVFVNTIPTGGGGNLTTIKWYK